MNKNPLVYLVPIVLVIGTAFGVGIVTGEVTEESDVEVGVDYVAPTIELTDWPTDVTWDDDDLDVEADVTAPGHWNAVDEVKFTAEYTGGEEVGDACGGPQTVTGAIVGEWNEGKATFEGEFDRDGKMLRAGEWEITATVYGTDPDCEDTDTKTTTVESYFEILGVDDAEAEGDPGDELTANDFSVPGNEDPPEIEVKSNDCWCLGEETKEVELTNNNGESFTIDLDYDEPQGDPTLGFETDLLYSGQIPWGQYHSTYDATVTHTLGAQQE